MVFLIIPLRVFIPFPFVGFGIFFCFKFIFKLFSKSINNTTTIDSIIFIVIIVMVFAILNFVFHCYKVLKDYQKENYLSVTTSAKRILNVVFLVPLFGYSKQTPLIILR